MRIRAALSSDAHGILAIWNPIISQTMITFTTIEKTADDIRGLIASCHRAEHAFLVAEDAGAVVGFASFGQFRDGPGYARTFEHSLYLAPRARRQGIGRALMGELEEAARAAQGHTMIAGISSANPSGRAFHRAMGYTDTAGLSEVGFKAGRWLDLHLMQKRL